MSPNAFIYEHSDIPAGMTADAYRRRPERPRRGRRAFRLSSLLKA